jgi:hypothetical protein
MRSSAVTKGLASHLKYCYGACVKRNPHLTPQQLGIKVRNILDHICDDHANCDSAWCYNKKAIEEKNHIKHQLIIDCRKKNTLKLTYSCNRFSTNMPVMK